MVKKGYLLWEPNQSIVFLRDVGDFYDNRFKVISANYHNPSKYKLILDPRNKWQKNFF